MIRLENLRFLKPRGSSPSKANLSSLMSSRTSSPTTRARERKTIISAPRCSRSAMKLPVFVSRRGPSRKRKRALVFSTTPMNKKASEAMRNQRQDRSDQQTAGQYSLTYSTTPRNSIRCLILKRETPKTHTKARIAQKMHFLGRPGSNLAEATLELQRLCLMAGLRSRIRKLRYRSFGITRKRT